MNLIWTTWTCGDRLAPTPVLRATQPSRFQSDRRQVLMIRGIVPDRVPETRGAYVEALTRMLLTGPLREDALAFDPDNAYEIAPLLVDTTQVDWLVVLDQMKRAVSSGTLAFSNTNTRLTWEESPLWTHRIGAFVLETAYQTIREA